MTSGPLLSPDALAQLVASGEDVVILDARASGYEAGHLAGAIRVDLNADLSSASDEGADPARGGRHPLPPFDRWVATLGRWGIGPGTTVVAYDDQSGANAAARVWWMLRASGHERVAVLDGGLPAAVAAGVKLETAVHHVEPQAPYPAEDWTWPVVDMERVDDVRTDPSWRVLDVRSGERYRGETEPIDPIAGHIPGALNLPYSENLRGGHYKSRDELRSMYHAFLGDVPTEKLIVHCGSGVTACHTLLALEVAGMTGAALYVGSWSEWCRNPKPRLP